MTDAGLAGAIEVGESDGRRLRANANRNKIVAAMIELVREGEAEPSAEKVAARAKLARRTVFRLFRDMDSLYQEMHGVMQARLAPMVSAPFTAATWRGRMHELLLRRVHLFEEMLPLKAAADMHRSRSTFLQSEHDKLVKLQREMVRFVAPAAVAGDTTLFAALDLVLSFETWKRLRHDQHLSRRQAQGVLERLLSALVGAD